ncbi:MAG TPA: HGGxSTG domain-containing protein [Roseomonas sp.]|nr:HGGxSTG domain-containing protein [Roseomonas sp.]
MNHQPQPPKPPRSIATAASAPRCGARTRSGEPCCAPAMANGRCRMHGGKSTGPRTSEGLERRRLATFKHGKRSVEARAAAQLRGEARRLLAKLRALLAEADKQTDST